MKKILLVLLTLLLFGCAQSSHQGGGEKELTPEGTEDNVVDITRVGGGAGLSTWDALPAGTLVSDDLMAITDVSDETQSTDGSSKKILVSDAWKPMIVSKSSGATLTDNEMYGVVWVTAEAIITLPAVEVGQSVCVYSTTAALVTVNPNDNDRIILDGAALSDGVAILSESAAGDFVCLIGDSAAGWTTLGMSGAWTEGT